MGTLLPNDNDKAALIGELKLVITGGELVYGGGVRK